MQAYFALSIAWTRAPTLQAPSVLAHRRASGGAPDGTRTRSLRITRPVLIGPTCYAEAVVAVLSCGPPWTEVTLAARGFAPSQDMVVRMAVYVGLQKRF